MNPEDIRIAGITLLAGLFAGIALAAEHYVLMPLQLSRVAAYTWGSLACLIPLSIALFFVTGGVMLALMPWGIWVIGGLATRAVYGWDSNVSEQLAKEGDHVRKS